MNIKHALLHNTSWRVLTMVFTFISNIIIVRLLGLEISGSFFYVLALFTLIGNLLRFGLESGIVYYATMQPTKIANLIYLLIFVFLLQLLLAVVGLNMFVKETQNFSFSWVVLFVMGNLLIYTVTAFYQVKKMYKSLNVVAALLAFMQTLFFAFLFFADKNILNKWGFANSLSDGVLFVMSIFVVIQVIILSVYFFVRNKDSFEKSTLEKKLVTDLFKYSFINFIGSLLLFLVMRADFYFVEKYCDIKSLGNYVQIAKIGQMALVFSGLVGGVIFPYSVDAGEAFASKIGFFCRVITLIFMMLFILLLIFGKFFFVWLLGADFNLMYSGMLATYLGVYCLSLNIIFTSFYEGINKQKIILVANFITLLLILIGDSFFVPQYGYMAAAVIFSLANFLGLIILLVSFKKLSGAKFKDIFFIRQTDLAMFRLR